MKAVLLVMLVKTTNIGDQRYANSNLQLPSVQIQETAKSYRIRANAVVLCLCIIVQ